MKITATLLHMAENEIKAMIPPYLFDDIKRRDPKPLFKVFVVGHEGKAETIWQGVGKVVKTWYADAIGKLSRKIWPGMKIFHNHTGADDPEREPIGEVAGSRTKTIKDKFSAIMVAYIYPEYKGLTLNVASIEADVVMDTSNINSDVRAPDLDNVEAVALGDGEVNRPGFEDATLLGQLQAFAEDKNKNEGDEKLELKEVKKFLKDEGIDPSEVFSKTQLIEDPVVDKHVVLKEKEAGTGEHKHRERTDKKFDEAREEWETKDKEKDKEIATLKKDGAKTTAADLIAKKITERKLTEKQAEYLKDRVGTFEVDDPDKVEKEVDDFMDSGLEDLKKVSKLLGVEEEEIDLPPGSEPTETQNAQADLMPG